MSRYLFTIRTTAIAITHKYTFVMRLRPPVSSGSSILLSLAKSTTSVIYLNFTKYVSTKR